MKYRSTWCGHWPGVLLLVLSLVTVWPGASVAEEVGELAKLWPLVRTAVQRTLCRLAKPGDPDIRFEFIRAGVPLLVKVVEDPAVRGRFHARVCNAEIFIGPFANVAFGTVDNMVLSVYVRRGRVYCYGGSEEWTWDESLGKPLERLLDEGEGIRFKVTVSPRCETEGLPIDPPSAEEERMIERILFSLRQFFLEANEAALERQERPRYPNEIRVVIQDFNVDDQIAQVLVKDPFFLVDVKLHAMEPTPEAEEEWQTSKDGYMLKGTTFGTLTWAERVEPTAATIREIRARGIERKIFLHEGAKKRGRTRARGTPKQSDEGVGR